MTNYVYGKSSARRLDSCDSKLQLLMQTVLAKSKCDISILCGHRNKEDQDAAFQSKRSKVSYPNSKHNSSPSRAVDVAPYPIDWDDLKRFETLADLVLDVADDLDIAVRWGGDWDMDGDRTDQTFNDLPHFELL